MSEALWIGSISKFAHQIETQRRKQDRKRKASGKRENEFEDNLKMFKQQYIWGKREEFSGNLQYFIQSY